MLDSVEATTRLLAAHDYITDVGLSTSIFLALRMNKALFLEGEPGVGKTELAKVLSRAFGTPLIRLQCYEGLDVNHAVYEWNYTRQILHLRLVEARGERPTEAELFDEAFLLKRPLLQAIERSRKKPAILLIDRPKDVERRQADRASQQSHKKQLDISLVASPEFNHGSIVTGIVR